MRTYDTDQFEIVFNGNLVAIEDCGDNLKNYICIRYKVDRHYEHDGQTFFVIQADTYDQDVFCEDMDDFCDISESSDDDLTHHINSLLAIASPLVKERIYDILGKIPRNVQDAGAVEQPNVQEKQDNVPESKPKAKPRTNNSIF